MDMTISWKSWLTATRRNSIALSTGGIAVTAHDAVAQRTVVNPYAYGGSMPTAHFQKRHKSLFDSVNLRLIFLVGVGEPTECAAGIDKIAGIDTHFVSDLGGGKSRAWIEVDISHQRNVNTLAMKQLSYTAYAFGFPDTLRGKADNMRPGIGDSTALGHRPLHIHSGSVGHGLQCYRIGASDRNITDTGNGGIPTLVIENSHVEELNWS